MQRNDRNDRLGRIRERMADSSQPAHNRRITDRMGLGDKNVYATSVIYHFAEPSARMKASNFAGVDWALAPKLARWWAVDADGQAHWFCLPNVAAFTAFWYSEPLLAPDFGFAGDWRESLVERPPDIRER